MHQWIVGLPRVILHHRTGRRVRRLDVQESVCRTAKLIARLEKGREIIRLLLLGATQRRRFRIFFPCAVFARRIAALGSRDLTENAPRHSVRRRTAIGIISIPHAIIGRVIITQIRIGQIGVHVEAAVRSGKADVINDAINPVGHIQHEHLQPIRHQHAKLREVKAVRRVGFKVVERAGIEITEIICRLKTGRHQTGIGQRRPGKGDSFDGAIGRIAGGIRPAHARARPRNQGSGDIIRRESCLEQIRRALLVIGDRQRGIFVDAHLNGAGIIGDVGVPQFDTDGAAQAHQIHLVGMEVCQIHTARRIDGRTRDLQSPRDGQRILHRKLIEVRQPFLRADDPRHAINIFQNIRAAARRNGGHIKGR